MDGQMEKLAGEREGVTIADAAKLTGVGGKDDAGPLRIASI